MRRSWYRLVLKAPLAFSLAAAVPGISGTGTTFRVPQNALAVTLHLLKKLGVQGDYTGLDTTDQWHPAESYPIATTWDAARTRGATTAADWGSVYFRSQTKDLPGLACAALAHNGVQRAILLVPTPKLSLWETKLEQELGFPAYRWVPPSKRKKNWMDYKEWVASRIHPHPFFLLAAHDQVGSLLNQQLPQFFLGGNSPALVIDEIQGFQNPRIFQKDAEGNLTIKDNRSAAAYRLSNYRDHLLRIGLSSKLDAPSPIHLLMQLFLLQPRSWGQGKWDFATRYCAAYPLEKNGRTVMVCDGVSNKEELQNRLSNLILQL